MRIMSPRSGRQHTLIHDVREIINLRMIRGVNAVARFTGSRIFG